MIKLASGNIETYNYDLSIQQLIEANLDYDQLRFEKILQHAILRFGFEKSVVRVFYPFMEKVGLLWVTEHLIPAQEHFSSCLIQQKILVAIDRLGSLALNREEVVLIFAPEGEMHEIPLLIALYYFRKHGIKTIYFGVNIALSKLEYYCNEKKVTHLYLHSITHFLNKEPADYIQCLLLKFPGTKIIVSGQAFKNIQMSSPLVKIVDSVEELMPVFLSL